MSARIFHAYKFAFDSIMQCVLLFSFLLFRYDCKLNILFSLQDPLNVYICADGSNYTKAKFPVDSDVGYSDKLLKDLKAKHFINMADFKDTSIQFIDMSKEKNWPDLTLWANKLRRVITITMLESDEQEIKNHFKNWLDKLSSSGKPTTKHIVMMDEISIAAFCKRDPFNDFIAALESGILESDEENIVPLDLELPEFVSSYSNIKIVISLSPTFTNGKLLSQPVNFQLNLPETNSQKYCQLVARYRNAHGILSFINFAAKEQCNLEGRFSELSKESDQTKTIDLPLPLTFPDENSFLKNCKPVVWIQDFSVAKLILDELDHSKEIQELKLRFDKPIVFIYGDERAISPEQQLFLDELKGRFEQESFHYEFFCGSEAEVVVFFNLKDFLNRTLHLPTLSRARKLLVLIDEPKIDIDMETTQFLGKALKQELVTCFSKSGDQIMRADGYRKRIDEQEYSTIAKKKLYVIEDMVPNFKAIGTLPLPASKKT